MQVTETRGSSTIGPQWRRWQETVHYANITRRQNNGTHSSTFSPRYPASGDGDFGHYRTKVVIFGLHTLGASGRFSSCVPFVWREGSLHHWDQPPHQQWYGVTATFRPGDHLDIKATQLQFFSASRHLTFAPLSFDPYDIAQDHSVIPQQSLLRSVSEPLRHVK